MGTARKGDAARTAANIRWLMWAYLLLILWNSLIPFLPDFGGGPGEQCARLIGLPVTGLHTPDLMSNIFAYVPLGALLALRYWRRTGSLLRATLWAVVVSAGLSYGVEFAQQFTATRISSAGDWLCNVSGAVVGALSAPLVFALARQARRRWLGELHASPLASLTKVYAAVLIVVALVPWSFTVSRALVLEQHRASQVDAVGLAAALVVQEEYASGLAYDDAAARRRDALETVMTGIWELLSFAVLAALVSRILEKDLGFGAVQRVMLTAWLVGGLAVLVGLMQLFVRFGSSNYLLLVCRLYGCALGVVSFRCVPGGWTRRDVIRRWAQRGFRLPRRTRWLLVPCAVFVVLYMGWVPFFVTTGAEGPMAINVPMLLPLYHYFQARTPVALEDGIFKLLRFGMLGMVLSMATGGGASLWSGRRAAVVVLWCGLAAALVELGQLYIPTRNPDVTDVLIGLLGGAGGVSFHLWVVDRLRAMTGSMWAGGAVVTQAHICARPGAVGAM